MTGKSCLSRWKEFLLLLEVTFGVVSSCLWSWHVQVEWILIVNTLWMAPALCSREKSTPHRCILHVFLCVWSHLIT